ncbi:MAG: hypothetical protein ABSG13_18095 [Bryobacteraceae bacterium]|jgi:hypothetical protein
MSMLDDDTLREVGRFAIEFNTLEEVITMMAGAILECTEWSVAQSLTERLTDGPKLDRVKQMCGLLAKAHGLEKTSPHKALLRQIGIAKGVVSERNAVIHGELTVKRGKPPTVQLRKQAVELSPRALSALVRKIDGVAGGLATAYLDFMIAVEESRDATTKKKSRHHT